MGFRVLRELGCRGLRFRVKGGWSLFPQTSMETPKECLKRLAASRGVPYLLGARLGGNYTLGLGIRGLGPRVLKRVRVTAQGGMCGIRRSCL